jgi:TRAP-type C4-dicarboxylate transport system permease small subunit
MVRGVSDGALKGTEMFLCIITGGMALLIGAQVFSRYFMNHSIFWAEEVGRITLVWITFLGASAAFKRRAHVGIDFFVTRLSTGAQRLCRRFVPAAGCMLFVTFVWHGSLYCCFVSSQKTPALGIPLFLPYLVFPLSGLLFLLHACDQLLEDLPDIKA